jgi:hypothetical protein
MKEFWNQRYAEKEYVYGILPNHFFKEQLALAPKGKILFSAEGEGRNAVYAALQGFDFFAFDNSKQAKNKAVMLAQKQKAFIDYHVVDFENINYAENSFDVLVFIFAHFPSEIRKQYHEKLLSYLKPNGLVIF